MSTTFKFVPMYGSEEAINNKELITGSFLMSEKGKIYFDKSDSERVLISTVDANYVHKQSTPSSFWEITHNLEKYPNVVVYDSAGTKVQGDVDYIDINSLTITFSAEFSGKAILN